MLVHQRVKHFRTVLVFLLCLTEPSELGHLGKLTSPLLARCRGKDLGPRRRVPGAQGLARCFSTLDIFRGNDDIQIPGGNSGAGANKELRLAKTLK